MPLRLPRRDDPRSPHPRLAAVLVAGVLLLAATPAGAATVLQNQLATPATGTTGTTFDLSVDYVSEPEARPALTVAVEVVGLGGSPLPMSLVAGDATNGTWQTSTMLPAGTWDLVFRADASGSDPPAVGLVLTVVDAATPTPSPSPGPGTPAPSTTPSPVATPTAPASAPSTGRPTPVPTPLPPGVTPTPAPPARASAASSAAPSQGDAASGSPAPSDGPSQPPSGSERPSSVALGTRSPAASPSVGDRVTGGSGWGRAGWVVLGGLTSVAGAAVLARQWLARRAASRT